MELGEKVKELIATHTREINVSQGQAFRLGLMQTNELIARIGPKRSSEKDRRWLQVNLTDIPPSDTLFDVMILKGDWVEIWNHASNPIKVQVTSADERHLYGIGNLPAIGIDREKGIAILKRGEAVTTSQGESPFHLTWENPDGKSVDLSVRSRIYHLDLEKHYLEKHYCLAMKYQIIPQSTS